MSLGSSGEPATPSLRHVLRQSGGYAIGTIGGRALPFLALPLVLRRLDPAEFGRLELATSLSSLLSAFVGLGVIEGVFRYFASSSSVEERRHLVAVGITFTATAGFICSLVLLCFAGSLSSVLFGQPGHGALVSAVLARVPLDAMAEFGRDIFRLEGRVKIYSLTLLAEAVIGVGGAVTLVYVLDGGAIHYMIGLLLASSFSVAFTAFRLRSWYRIKFDRRVLRRLLAFGLPLGLQSVAVYVYSYSDRAFLAHLDSLAVVGEYSLASKITVLPLLVAGSFGRAWHPYYLLVNATVGEVAARLFIARSATAISAAFILLSMSTALVAPIILRIVAPGTYSGSILAVAGLSIAVAFQVSQEFTFIGMLLGGRPGVAAVIRVIGALLNTVLNVLLIPPFAASGAAWATAASFALISILAFTASQRVWPVPFEARALAGLFAAGVLILLVIGRFLAQPLSVQAALLAAGVGLLVGAAGLYFISKTRPRGSV